MKQIPENIQDFARQKGISLSQAIQTFLQVLVLKNLSWGNKKMIGGTVLVLGHGNPRFSEDIDLTQVSDVSQLEASLAKSLPEMETWLHAQARLTPPKAKKSTWKISVGWKDSNQNIRLHIDSQPYPAHSSHLVLVNFPGIPVFLIPSVQIEEIMADKLIALASRPYVSGRDVFDLWYHWLQSTDWMDKTESVLNFLKKKIRDRKVAEDPVSKITTRLGTQIATRCRDEWDRYLPQGMQDEKLYRQIYSDVQEKIKKLSS